MLSNPPWERVKLQEKEWFASRHPEIANAPNAASRKRKIEALETDDPPLFHAFKEAVRESEGISHFLRNTSLYPLCGRGDINLTPFLQNQTVVSSIYQVQAVSFDRHRHRRHHKVLLPGLDGLKVTEKSL